MMSQRERLTSTRSVWLASWFLANGLPFVRATRLAGRALRINFFFDDSANTASALTAKFLADRATQRMISGRRVLSEAMNVARDRAVCEADDIAAELALVSTPWGEERR